MANTSLTTVEEIKQRLRIPVTQTDQDAVIDAYRMGIEEDILTLTGYTFVAGQRVDQVTDWQRGTSRLTQLRPVLTLVQVEGRVADPSASYSALVGDVKNAKDGRVLLVGFQDAPFDPRSGDSSGYSGAGWYKWREYVWPVARITYTVDPLGSETNPIPKMLRVAALEWCAAIMSRPAGVGPIQSVSIEKISESYGAPSRGTMPSVTTALLARHMRDLVSLQS